MGIGGIILASLVLYALSLWAWFFAATWIEDYRMLNIWGEFTNQFDSIGAIGAVVLTFTLLLCLFYLFLVMMQYIVKHVVTALVFGVLAIFSVPYIYFAVEIMRPVFGASKVGSGIEQLINSFNLSSTMRTIITYQNEQVVSENWINYYTNHYTLGWREVMFVSMCLLYFSIIMYLSKRYGLRSFTSLTISPFTDNVLRIAFTISAATMPIYLRNLFYNFSGTILWACVIVFGIIGFVFINAVIKMVKESK